jgi:hypothetical protein
MASMWDKSCRRRVAGVIGIGLTFALFHASIAFAQRSDVAATVTAFSNLRSGQIFNCIDPVSFGCDRGDLYPIMMITDANGVPFGCDTPPPIINADVLTMPPGWTCTAPGAQEPVTFSLLVRDFDGRFLNALDGDDFANLGSGAGTPERVTVPSARRTPR